MNEKYFKNDILKAEFDKRFANGHWQPIENSFGLGIPDVNCCALSINWWLETKYKDRAPINNGKIDVNFKLEQARWQMQRRKAGGNAITLLYIKRSEIIYAIDPELQPSMETLPWIEVLQLHLNRGIIAFSGDNRVKMLFDYLWSYKHASTVA